VLDGQSHVNKQIGKMLVLILRICLFFKECESERKKPGIVINMSLDHARAQYAQYRANGCPWTTR
jgi:hypothetical protein